MDSLLSLELRNRLQGSLARSLPTTLTFNYPTIETLLEFLAGILELAPDTAGVAEPAPAPPRPPSSLDQIAQMADDDVQHLLRRRS